VYKIDSLIAMSGLYALVIFALKMKPAWKDAVWSTYILSGAFLSSGLLLLPEPIISKLIWLNITLAFTSFPILALHKRARLEHFRPIPLVVLWVAWICAYFSIQLPLAPYRWLFGIAAVGLSTLAAEPSRLKTHWFHLPKSRLLVALAICLAAVAWLPLSLDNWGTWVRYGKVEGAPEILKISFLSSWFFIAAFSWLMWPFLFSWAESLSHLNKGTAALLSGLQVPLSLACFFVLPVLGEHYPQMCKLVALGLLLSALYALIRTLIIVHYQKLIIYLYSAMTCLVISGASLQLLSSESDLYSIVEMLLVKQVVLFICLLLVLSRQRLVPAERPLVSELKHYAANHNIMIFRLLILVTILVGIGGYLFAVFGLPSLKAWNIVFIIGAILAALISVRLLKRVFEYVR
jgi:hypothetical protein